MAFAAPSRGMYRLEIVMASSVIPNGQVRDPSTLPRLSSWLVLPADWLRAWVMRWR